MQISLRPLLAPAALVGTLLLAPAAAVLGASLAAGPAGSAEAPAADTIVEVEGDKANGFGIHFYDGSALFPPTDSEARAECGEYDAKLDRVRCRVEVRTWYRDLGDLKQALEWAHSS